MDLDYPPISIEDKEYYFLHYINDGDYGVVVKYTDHEKDYVFKIFYPTSKQYHYFEKELNNMKKIKKLLSGCINNIICYKFSLIIKNDESVYDQIFHNLTINSNKKFVENEPIYILVSEYIDGINLYPSRWITDEENNFVTPEEVKGMNKYKFIEKFMIQMLNTFRMLHEKNIIHGDVKPYNIIYNHKKDLFVLIDFGLSCIEECFGFFGTIKYFPNKFYQLYKNDKIKLDYYKMKDIHELIVTLYVISNTRYPIITKKLNDFDYEYNRSSSNNDYIDLFLNSYFDDYIKTESFDFLLEKYNIQYLLDYFG